MQKEIKELEELANQELKKELSDVEYWLIKGESETAKKALIVIEDLQMRLRVMENSAERRLKIIKKFKHKSTWDKFTIAGSYTIENKQILVLQRIYQDDHHCDGVKIMLRHTSQKEFDEDYQELKLFKNKKTGKELEGILRQNSFDPEGRKLILSWDVPMKLDPDWITLEDEYFEDMQDFNNHYEEIK